MSLIIFKAKEHFAYLAGGSKVIEEKRRMTETIGNLRYRIAQLESLKRENRELRKHLNFTETSRHRLIMCRVVNRGGASGWWSAMTLNMGSEQGISPLMAVITPEGLVGKTFQVTPNTCTVVLVTDPSCKVSCRFEDSDAVGIVRGLGVDAGGRSELELLYALPGCIGDYIAPGAVIREGDSVFTSGLGGTYPRGIPVGKVTRTENDSSLLYQRAYIEPAAKMAALKYVFVVDTAPGKTGLEE